MGGTLHTTPDSDKATATAFLVDPGESDFHGAAFPYSTAFKPQQRSYHREVHEDTGGHGRCHARRRRCRSRSSARGRNRRRTRRTRLVDDAYRREEEAARDDFEAVNRRNGVLEVKAGARR
jgi:hypothetical protein